MKQRLLLLGIFTAFGFSAFSQSARFVGGLNFSNVSVTNGGRVNDANMITSFHAGVIGDISLGGPVYLQPGLLYSGKGSKIQSGTPGTNGYYRQTFNPYYFEIPANVVFKTPSIGIGRFFAGAGPYLGVGVRGKIKTEGQNMLGLTYTREADIRFSDDNPATLSEEEGAGLGIVRRFDYGLNATAGFEGRNLVLSVIYGHGLAKLQSGANNSENDNNKHRVIGVQLGFKF